MMWYASFAIVVAFVSRAAASPARVLHLRPPPRGGAAPWGGLEEFGPRGPWPPPPPLQIPEARPDRIRRLGDRFDPCVEPLDLSIHLIVDEEVRPNRDERLLDILRFGDQERIRANWHEDFGGLPGFPVPQQRFAGPHVLLQRDAHDLLLPGQRLDLRPILIEDRDPPSEFGLAGAHARASSAYRTA